MKYYKDGQPALCQFSMGRSMGRMASTTLQVYAGCKSTLKRRSGNHYFLDSVQTCHDCDKCKPQKR